MCHKRIINNCKIAAIYASAIFLGYTLQNPGNLVMAETNARQEVINTINNTPVDKSEQESETLIWSRDWDESEGMMLKKIAMAEAEGEGAKGKALVMLTVLNRVWDDRFPGTIEEVIFQDGQFSPVSDGGRYWTTEPDEECQEALEMVLHGWDESKGALYFEAAHIDGWVDRNCEFLYQHGNHKFFR